MLSLNIIIILTENCKDLAHHNRRHPFLRFDQIAKGTKYWSRDETHQKRNAGQRTSRRQLKEEHVANKFGRRCQEEVHAPDVPVVKQQQREKRQ